MFKRNSCQKFRPKQDQDSDLSELRKFEQTCSEYLPSLCQTGRRHNRTSISPRTIVQVLDVLIHYFVLLPRQLLCSQSHNFNLFCSHYRLLDIKARTNSLLLYVFRSFLRECCVRGLQNYKEENHAVRALMGLRER